jgi:hypothetical protein
MSYKTVSLTDLRIRTRNENRNSFNERSVTRSDIEAVVRDLGAVEVQRCSIHRADSVQPGVPSAPCVAALAGGWAPTCQFESVLFVSFDTGDTE